MTDQIKSLIDSIGSITATNIIFPSGSIAAKDIPLKDLISYNLLERIAKVAAKTNGIKGNKP